MSQTTGESSVPKQYPPGFRARRGLNWGFLGLLYTSFYMCRYNFSIANKSISEEFGFSRGEMGYIITTALFAYACGQIINGLLTDRLGGRAVFAIGGDVEHRAQLGLQLQCLANQFFIAGIVFAGRQRRQQEGPPVEAEHRSGDRAVAHTPDYRVRHSADLVVRGHGIGVMPGRARPVAPHPHPVAALAAPAGPSHRAPSPDPVCHRSAPTPRSG